MGSKSQFVSGTNSGKKSFERLQLIGRICFFLCMHHSFNTKHDFHSFFGCFLFSVS